MTALVEYGIKCLHHATNFFCPDPSVLKSSDFRKCCEENLICDVCEKFVSRLNKHDDVIEWNFMKIAPPKWRAGCAPGFINIQFLQLASQTMTFCVVHTTVNLSIVYVTVCYLFMSLLLCTKLHDWIYRIVSNLQYLIFILVWGCNTEWIYFVSPIWELFSPDDCKRTLRCRGSQTFSGHVPLQYFDTWACTPKHGCWTWILSREGPVVDFPGVGQKYFCRGLKWQNYISTTRN